MHINLMAYDDVERIESFSQKSFESYCLKKLKIADKYLEFIKRAMHDYPTLAREDGLAVGEIGSGNGNLLYRIEQAKILRRGYGLEISKSRVEFAEKFKAHLGILNTANMNLNVLAAEPLESIDLIVAVDFVVSLIAPVHDHAERRLLQWIHSSLSDAGCIIFELSEFDHVLGLIDAFGVKPCQYWEEFDASDNWRFGLYKITRDGNGDLVWDKTFIKRESGEISQFTNIIRPYSFSNIASLLKANGFGNIRYYRSWNPKTDEINQHHGYIVMAQKSQIVR